VVVYVDVLIVIYNIRGCCCLVSLLVGVVPCLPNTSQTRCSPYWQVNLTEADRQDIQQWLNLLTGHQHSPTAHTTHNHNMGFLSGSVSWWTEVGSWQ
jgi:hypothetical protein